MSKPKISPKQLEAIAKQAGGKELRINLPDEPKAKKERRPLPAFCLLTPSSERGRWEVRIPEWRPHTLNELMGVHFMVASRLKYHDAQIIGQSLKGAGVPKAAGKRRAQFVIVMGPGQRKPDPDAFFKSGLDALKRCGALVDDNPKWLDLLPTLYERQSVRATRVILEDVGE